VRIGYTIPTKIRKIKYEACAAIADFSVSPFLTFLRCSFNLYFPLKLCSISTFSNFSTNCHLDMLY
ncbi:hypothetical protein L9F63_008470, partial [Diploptera punctata]